MAEVADAPARVHVPARAMWSHNPSASGSESGTSEKATVSTCTHRSVYVPGESVWFGDMPMELQLWAAHFFRYCRVGAADRFWRRSEFNQVQSEGEPDTPIVFAIEYQYHQLPDASTLVTHHHHDIFLDKVLIGSEGTVYYVGQCGRYIVWATFKRESPKEEATVARKVGFWVRLLRNRRRLK